MTVLCAAAVVVVLLGWLVLFAAYREQVHLTRYWRDSWHVEVLARRMAERSTVTKVERRADD